MSMVIMKTNVEMKTLYNCTSSNIVGYCCYHKCGITTKQLKKKECLKKNCNYLKKNECHQLWAQRERAKAKKKANKHIMELTI